MARPLTKRNQYGVPYVRPRALEFEIDDALRLDLSTLRRRLLITDRASPEYLQSECLIHLIRDALRSGDDQRRDAILEVLLRRCEAILKAKISDGEQNAEKLREMVMSDFAELLASDGRGEQPNELDFYECKFNLAFRTLRIDVIRNEKRHLKRNAQLPAHEDEGEPDAYEDVFARLSEAFRIPSTQESHLFLEELVEAINALPNDERKAVILCHKLGYKEESEDPDEVTAATLCKCSGRTIRNRLSRAAAKLSRFKEDI